MMNRKTQRTWKLFGSRYDGGSRSKHQPKRWPIVVISLFLCIVIGYLVCVYSSIPFIKKWRTIYIETAMSTLNHQWLATAFLPESVVQSVVDDMQEAMEAQIGLETTIWEEEEIERDGMLTVSMNGAGTTTGDEESETAAETETENADSDIISAEEAAFYNMFWELDRKAMNAYLDEHPELMENGWDHIYINEAGLDDDGIPVYTTMGEQVLALDAYNQVLLVRIKGTGYRGVMAIAKDPSRLSICAASTIGECGQYAGTIAENNNGILAMTANGFADVDGVGNGGTIEGYTMCNGVEYGRHSLAGYKRVELRENNLLYIVDAGQAVGSDVTDAAEFIPALIIDGETVVTASSGYTALNPRTCIGQSSRYEILFLVIEGRLVGYSFGTDAMECAEILARHDCLQAMNLDGGTSAILYFDGEYVTRCSNPVLDSGRALPNAIVYARAE